MKRIFYSLCIVVGLAALTTSCAKNDCCTCSNVEICKNDYNAANNGGLTWDEWKEASQTVNPLTGQPICNC